jgi:hypothetical protein
MALPPPVRTSWAPTLSMPTPERMNVCVRTVSDGMFARHTSSCAVQMTLTTARAIRRAGRVSRVPLAGSGARPVRTRTISTHQTWPSVLKPRSMIFCSVSRGLRVTAAPSQAARRKRPRLHAQAAGTWRRPTALPLDSIVCQKIMRGVGPPRGPLFTFENGRTGELAESESAS